MFSKGRWTLAKSPRGNLQAIDRLGHRVYDLRLHEPTMSQIRRGEALRCLYALEHLGHGIFAYGKATGTEFYAARPAR